MIWRLMRAGNFVFAPWIGVMFARLTGKPRPYFGVIHRPYIGPDLKLINLKRHFGSHWLCVNIVYVVSGVPPALLFLRWAKWCGCKIVLNQNGIPRKRGRWEALAKIHQLVDYIIYQSEFCFRESLRDYGPPRVGNEVLYNAVDTEKFNPGPPPEYEYPARILSKLWMPERGHLRFPNFIFKVYPLSGAIVMNGNMPDVYRNHHLFVAGKENDPSPNSVLEAMACGLPVVYHRSGGTPELVGEAGIGYETDQERMDAILSVWRDSEKLSRLSRERAMAFDMKPWLRRHEEIFHDIHTED